MTPARVRCAVYTRKSTDEGLDQAFNSLDAQREACRAYVMSQAGEGWVLTEGVYDDGGYSGGTMERPALKALLAGIDQGRIDVVVVYKIDRLTRSLADFARIVERLDRRGASFISVTQAFNTTTSMGRLTLNVLLSFAQFEREIGAERVRDKIAASRRKGLWMGGVPPLGYVVRDKALVVDEAEAASVRLIFARYLALGSLARLRAELEARGLATKRHEARNGRVRGGGRWHVGALRHLLRNRVYIGAAIHKGAAYRGLHDAIVDAATFEAVQAALDAGRIKRKARVARHSPGLLTGLIHDDAGHAMSPQTTTRPRTGARRVYYVSQGLLQRRATCGSLARVPAARIEPLVLKAVQDATSRLTDGDDPRGLIRRHVLDVVVSLNAVTIDLRRTHAHDGAQKKEIVYDLTDAPTPALTRDDRLTLPISLARASTAATIANAASWTRPAFRRDPALLRALARAHDWRARIERGEVVSLERIALQEGLTRNSVRQILRLAFLAPDLQIAILDGRQPTNLTISSALKTSIPPQWNKQRDTFPVAQSDGYGSPRSA